MVVISILVGIAVPSSKYFTDRARKASQRIYIEKIKSALEDYRAAYGEYPITPQTNFAGDVTNLNDVVRHYDIAEYQTACFVTSNSPYTTVNFHQKGTVENLKDMSRQVDYCLTYPLMLKQRARNARPFMEFPEITMGYYVYGSKIDYTKDTFEETIRIKTADGAKPITYKGVRGNPINRPIAIDPMTGRQWKYRSGDGVTYSIETNSF